MAEVLVAELGSGVAVPRELSTLLTLRGSTGHGGVYNGKPFSLSAEAAMPRPSDVVQCIVQCKVLIAGFTGPPTRGVSGQFTLQTHAFCFDDSESVALDELGDSFRVTEVMLKLLHLWRQRIEAVMGHTASARAVAAVQSC